MTALLHIIGAMSIVLLLVLAISPRPGNLP
jgi:hypothetical protein